MTRDVDMIMYGGRGLEMFLEPVFKISGWFSYIFMITVIPATFESVYDPTSFKDWVFILRGHQEVFDGMTSFQMHLNAIFFTSSLVALTQPLMVRYHYVCFWSFVVVSGWLLAIWLVPLRKWQQHLPLCSIWYQHPIRAMTSALNKMAIRPAKYKVITSALI